MILTWLSCRGRLVIASGLAGVGAERSRPPSRAACLHRRRRSLSSPCLGCVVFVISCSNLGDKSPERSFAISFSECLSSHTTAMPQRPVRARASTCHRGRSGAQPRRACARHAVLFLVADKGRPLAGRPPLQLPPGNGKSPSHLRGTRAVLCYFTASFGCHVMRLPGAAGKTSFSAPSAIPRTSPLVRFGSLPPLSFSG